MQPSRLITVDVTECSTLGAVTLRRGKPQPFNLFSLVKDRSVTTRNKTFSEFFPLRDKWQRVVLKVELKVACVIPLFAFFFFYDRWLVGCHSFPLSLCFLFLFQCFCCSFFLFSVVALFSCFSYSCSCIFSFRFCFVFPKFLFLLLFFVVVIVLFLVFSNVIIYLQHLILSSSLLYIKKKKNRVQGLFTPGNFYNCISPNTYPEGGMLAYCSHVQN